MEFIVGQLIKAIIFPPGIFIVLILIAMWLINHHTRAAKRVLAFTAATLYLLSLPIVAEILMTPLEPYPALSRDAIQKSSAKAIVVLSAGRSRHSEEYDDKDVSGDYSFGRLKYGAKLHRLSQLPILITGGLGDDDKPPLAELMAKDLADSFNISAKWQETKSSNTAENAAFSFEILRKEGIKEIFLVTDAWHMPRAVYIFEKQGFVVTPAPTRFNGLNEGSFDIEFSSILPSTKALMKSYFSMHEILGLVWYKIRY